MTASPAPQIEPQTPLDQALEYNRRGWPVFPCREAPEDVVDSITGEVETRGAKTPLIPNGLNGATLNAPLIGRLWARHPTAMIGIPTGEKIGAWVLDIDVPPGHEDGRLWLAEMEAIHGPLPETRTATTASGGRHFYWKYTAEVKNRAAVGPGVDLRGAGGYVIAPGSVMADGRCYTWDNDALIAEAPDWLMQLVTPRQAPPVATTTYTHADSGSADRYTEVSVADELRSLASQPPGGRGALVNATAYRLGRFVGANLLNRAEAEAGLFAAAQSNGIVTKDGEREVRAKIRRGLDAGMRDPKQIPEPEVHRDDTRPLDPAALDRFVRNSVSKQQSTADDDRVAANDNVPPGLSIFEWTVDRFVGEAPAVEWLVDGVIPLGVPGMVSAAGDTGKSFALLELHRRIAFGSAKLASPVFGGKVVAEGTSVMITSEDDAGEVHRRISAIDPKGDRHSGSGKRMIVVPLPSAGGARAFWREDRKLGLIETDEFKRICDQLSTVSDLRLVTFDPLASFAHLPLNEDPTAGQFVCSSLARLAAETKSTILVAHHMRKSKAPIESLADAREAIRGSTALVDGLRVAYAMWPADEAKAKAACKQIGVTWQPNRIVLGGIVKANGPARRILSTYARGENGLLVDRTAATGSSSFDQVDLRTALVIAVEAAAAVGAPFTKTGTSGLFEMRERLPDELRGLAKGKLDMLAAQALERGEIVRAAARGEKTAKWLDVPGGMFAVGLGTFTAGAPR